MSQIIQKLDQQQLKSLCGIVAHTSEGLTKSELTTLLGQCRICSVDDGSSRNQLVWGDRIFEKCGIGRDEGGDGGKTLEIRGKRRLPARDRGANYQQS